jgi:CBS-domain-containing membrane protein
MKAHDVMTWGAITVEPDASVTRAVRLMLQNKISGLPVVDAKGQLVGMVTEGDFLRRGELGTQRQRSRWLEFLLGPGKLANRPRSNRRAEGLPDLRLSTQDHHAADAARRGRA